MSFISKIFHGGNIGGQGSWPSGGGASDKLLDQLGNVLLQGISNVVHLLTGKSIEVNTDLNATINRDSNVSVGRNRVVDVAVDDQFSIGGDTTGTFTGDVNIGFSNATLNSNAGNYDLEVNGGKITNYCSGMHSVEADGTFELKSNAAGNSAIVSAGNIGIQVGGSLLLIVPVGGVKILGIKSGATQGAAGAVATELWQETGTNTIKIGV
jgi:hypothetical protein